MENSGKNKKHEQCHRNVKGSDDSASSDKNNELLDISFQPGDEVLSSLPLQMSLYFNVVFLPFWCGIMVTMVYLKYDSLSSIYRFIEVLVLTSLILTECVRLYLGYLGNLSEKIPELAGFWILSLLLQFPLHLFVLLSVALRPQPIERIAESVMLIFLIAQLFTGFGTLRRCAYYHAQRYQLQYAGKVKSSPGQT